MLAPSYIRSKHHRERGISLSRVESVRKVPQSTVLQVRQLNKSFQCVEPRSYMTLLQNNLNQSLIHQTKQNCLPQKYQTTRKQPSALSHYRNRSVLQPSSKDNIIHTENKQSSIDLWQQTESIGQMIELLVTYQKTCQQQMDLASAEEARKRINDLKKQEIQTKRKQLEVQTKQYIIKTRRQGQEEFKEFQVFWNQKISQAKQALKEIEDKHLEEQRKQLQAYQIKIQSEPHPKIKYSSKVLENRRNLTSLIKSRKYKQAEHLKTILEKKEIEEEAKWETLCQQKKLIKIKEFTKRQAQQFQAFKLKLASSFNELLKQKQKQCERMSKKMKKNQVEASKTPSVILKARASLLNQSKAKISKDQF